MKTLIKAGYYLMLALLILGTKEEALAVIFLFCAAVPALYELLKIIAPHEGEFEYDNY